MDDDAQIRHLAGQILPYLGYTVSFAEDGEEAIRIFQKEIGSTEPSVCVILDLTVPGGMGGRKRAAQLRPMRSGQV